MSHTAEIIAVGTELLLGNITNTNASEISRALSAVGVNVFWHTVVGDNPERLREALKIARKRADVILTTGGLGPTYDDLTKQTVCETFGKPLVLREDVLEHIRTYFARNVHLVMPENNRQQAEFPADCVIFDNPVGTAPGCAFEAEGVHVLMLPGPPFEMRTMLQNWAVPYLRGLSKEAIVSHDIMTFGLGESPMEDLMRERISRMENPSLATYAKPSEVRLRATAKADSAAAADAMLLALRLMENEITARRTPMPEIIDLLAKNENAVVRQIFSGVRRRMRERSGLSLSYLWCAGMRAAQADAGLGREECGVLCDAANFLGRYDASEQKAAIDTALHRLQMLRELAFAELRDRGSLYRTCGIAAGLLVILVLV